MADIPVIFTPKTMPEGLCFNNDQERLNWFVNNGLSGTLDAAFSGVIVQNTEPGADLRDNLWIQTDGASQNFLGYWLYSFAYGLWIRPHEVPLNSDEVRMWKGSEADLDTYDGGSAGLVTATTGPFWEIDSTFAAFSPMGVGALPSGQAITVGATYGEEKHTQTVPELAEHAHEIPEPLLSRSGATPLYQISGSVQLYVPNFDTENTGESQPFNVVHPVIGVYFIKRTGRIYRTP